MSTAEPTAPTKPNGGLRKRILGVVERVDLILIWTLLFAAWFLLGIPWGLN